MMIKQEEENKKSKANDIENVNVNIQQVMYVDDSTAQYSSTYNV